MLALVASTGIGVTTSGMTADASSTVQVSVFNYDGLNGSAGSDDCGVENSNLLSIIDALPGYTADGTIDDFTDANLAQQLADSRFFFMTDMERQDPNLTSFFPTSAQTTLRNWVNGGGVMVMTGTWGSYDNDMLNLSFGWDLSQTTGSSWAKQTANTAGTPFASVNAASLGAPSATDGISAGSVANFTPMWGTSSNATVAVIEYGSGYVIFLGFDFFNTGAPGISGVTTYNNDGRRTQTRTACPNYSADPSSGTTDSIWVSAVLPAALQYATTLADAATNSGPSGSGPSGCEVDGKPCAVRPWPTATAGPRGITVTWEAPGPLEDGRGGVVSYRVESSPSGGNCVLNQWDYADGESLPTSCTILDLDPDTDYLFTVYASSHAGEGPGRSSQVAVRPLASSVPSQDNTEPVFVTEDDAPLLERQPGTSGAILNGVPIDTRQSAGDRTVIQRFIAGQPAGASNPVTVNGDNQLPSLITDDDDTPVPIPDTNIVIVETDTTALAIAAQRADGQPAAIRSDGALVVDRGRVGTAGYGFTPSRVGEIVLFSEPQLVGTFTTDATGAFTAQFDLPTDLEPGPHTIVLTLGNETKAVGIYVEADTPTVATPTPATLPVTGDTTPINWIILALTLGTWTLLATRRRTSA